MLIKFNRWKYKYADKNQKKYKNIENTIYIYIYMSQQKTNI